MSCEKSKRNKNLEENFDSLAFVENLRKIDSIQKIKKRERERLEEDSLNQTFIVKRINDSLFQLKIDKQTSLFLKNHIGNVYENDTFLMRKGNQFLDSQNYAVVKYFVKGKWGCLEVWSFKNNTWKKEVEDCNSLSICTYYIKDVNGDNTKDFLMQNYGLAGTGEKWYNKIYLYDSYNEKLIPIDMVVMNPFYDVEKKMFTTHYFANGGGNGEKYIWKGFKPVLVESLSLNPFVEERQTKASREVYKIVNNKQVLVKHDTIDDYYSCCQDEYKKYVEIK